MKRILVILFILAIAMLCCSCEKREPEEQPDPGVIMKKISGQFPEYKEINYESGNEAKKLSESNAAELYSDDKNKPVDLSKIEKYSVVSKSNTEIGIFKIYDKTNAHYVKEMANTRISKMQNAGVSESTLNDAESRSYGNYVYYVSHPEKDKIFEIIEDTLRGENEKGV